MKEGSLGTRLRMLASAGLLVLQRGRRQSSTKLDGCARFKQAATEAARRMFRGLTYANKRVHFSGTRREGEAETDDQHTASWNEQKRVPASDRDPRAN